MRSKSKRFTVLMRVVRGANLRSLVLLNEQLSDKVMRVLWGFSSSGRAPALQAGGERFDPVNLHQVLKQIQDFKIQSF